MKRFPQLTPEHLARVLPRPAPGAAWRIALSGGLDSSVLLDLMAHLSRPSGISLSAVHVDHGLHARSGDWARHCVDTCSGYGIPCQVVRVHLPQQSSEGPEAAARAARYAALESATEAGDVLLTAHHMDDQAETLLLRLMRGAGVRGLAGIPGHAAFGAGRLARPLMRWQRADLQRYAESRHLIWLEDPSNRDESLDRNYVRHSVIPALGRRWQAASELLARSAAQAAEAAALLDELAALDHARCAGERPDILDGVTFARLNPARRRNLLAYWLRERGFPVPPRRRLEETVSVLAQARHDASPLIAWPGVELRRWRDEIYAMTPLPPAPDAAWQAHWAAEGTLELPPGCGQLHATTVSPTQGGISLRKAEFQVAFRRGGERLRPSGHAHHKTLKQLWQEAGVPPWVRVRTPLLSHDGQLVAVGDMWVADDWVGGSGRVSARLVWERGVKPGRTNTRTAGGEG